MPEREPITAVEYGELDGDGEVVAWHRIVLSSNGDVDLSALPGMVRDKWMHMGILLPMNDTPIFPHEGERFLRALLHRNGPYLRIRESKNSARSV